MDIIIFIASNLNHLLNDSYILYTNFYRRSYIEYRILFEIKKVSGPLFIKDYDTQFNSMIFKNEEGAVEPNIGESIVIHIYKGFYPYCKKLNAI